MTTSNSVLKSSARRSTRTGGEHDREVRKQFHSRGWRRLGDRRRAEREYQHLLLAYTAGLPVPRPLAVRRHAGGWCLTMERIAGARSFATVLDREPERITAQHGEQLGRLLAQLAHLRLEHGDLHPGNLLLDESDRLWLIDFGLARRSEARDGCAELVTLLAGLREQTGRELRDVLVRTFVEFAPAGRVALDPDALALAARAERRAVVLRNLDRWTRTSGVAEQLSVAGRRELRARREPDAHATIASLAGGEARSAWLVAARLFEHHVPVLAPLRLVTRPTSAAEFELPAGVRPVSEVGDDACRLARSYGTLLGTLHDRGLQPVPPLELPSEPRLLVAPTGELLLHPLVQLTELPLEVPPPLPEPAASLTDATRPDFEAGYRAALRDALPEAGAPAP